MLLDGEFTLKRVLIQKAGKQTIVILKGARPDFEDVVFSPDEHNFKIQGIAIEIVRRRLN